MNKNLITGAVVVVILLVGGWFLLGSKMMTSQTNTPEEAAPSGLPVASVVIPAVIMESTGSSLAEGAKEFTVTGSNFKFDTSEIRVKEGDTVKITFKNAGGTHDFVIDEFDVAAKQASGPSEEVLEFVADKAGTYEFYCSVGKHRAMGMKGKFIVE